MRTGPNLICVDLFVGIHTAVAYAVLMILKHGAVLMGTPGHNVLHPGACGVGCLSSLSVPLVSCCMLY